MSFDYYKFINDRLSIIQRVIKRYDDTASGKLWQIEPSNTRFHLGESITDIKIPYLLGSDDETIIEKAIAEIALLLKKRFDVPSDETKEEVLDLPVSIKTNIIDATCRIDIFPLNFTERAVAVNMLLSVPFIDSGIIKYWLGHDGSGRQFMERIKAILVKSIKEEMGLMGAEKTSYITMLALLNTILKKKEILKSIRVKKLGYERLERIVGFLIFFLFNSVLSSIEEEMLKSKILYNIEDVMLTLKSSLNLQSFVTISGNIIQQDLNPYKIPRDIVGILAPVYESTIHRSKDIFEIIELMKNEAKSDPFFTDALVKINSQNALRQVIIEYLMDYDISGMYVHSLLRDIYQNQKALLLVFNDADFRKRIYNGLNDIRMRFIRDSKRVECIDRIIDFIDALGKARFWDWFKGPEEKTDEILSASLKGFLAYKFDEDTEVFVSAMRSALVDRRIELTPQEMMQDYERGRIYRFSYDERPILNVAASASEGLLFVDMKDFTRKTLKVKEASMSEFMKDNFYMPILEASKKYGASGGVSAVFKGIQIENFLGDAVIFSGGITNLISFATDIQKVIRSYKEKLKKRIESISKDVLSSIRENYEKALDELKRQEMELDNRIKQGDREAEERLVELKNKETYLGKAYKAEIENIEAGMDAGLFISYGTKAETIVIHDDYWGTLKVAIGEKINEAARGTSRNSLVKAKRDALIERERAKRNAPDISYPFDVFIDKTYSIAIPPELDTRIDEMIVHKDLENIKEIAKVVADDCYSDLKKVINHEPISLVKSLSTVSDIYNKGQAMTDAALEAYMQETKNLMVFFKKEVSISELHPDIQEGFFFPESRIELWFCIDVSGKMDTLKIFSRSGSVIFKGFEAATPTVVYEILDTSSGFFTMIKKHHFQEWFEDAKIHSGKNNRKKAAN